MKNAMTKKQEEEAQEVNQLLHDIQTKPWLAEGLAEHDYNEDSLAEGRSLLNTGYATAEAKKAAYAHKLGATKAVKVQYELTWKLADALTNTSIILFQGRSDLLDALGVHESLKDDNNTSRVARPRKNSRFDRVLAWLRNLFSVAQTHAEIASILAENGFPPAKLAEGAAAVEALDRANLYKEEAKAKAKQATAARNKAFRALRKWYGCIKSAVELVESNHEAAEEQSGGALPL